MTDTGWGSTTRSKRLITFRDRHMKTLSIFEGKEADALEIKEKLAESQPQKK